MAPVKSHDILAGHCPMSRSPATQGERFEHPQLVAVYGFVPNLFHAQSQLPRAIKAEERLVDAVVVCKNRLSRHQKESVLCGVASIRENDYCRALFGSTPPATSPEDSALLQFTLKLARYGAFVSGNDVELLRGAGFDDAAILEAVVTIALGQMLCTLAEGLRPALDPGLAPPPPANFPELHQSLERIETPGPYLRSPTHAADNFQPFTFLREEYGFVPNLYRDQILRPDLVEAEVHALAQILLPEDHLSRIQKEQILLSLSAANLNTYYVTMRGQILSTLGVSLEESDQIIEDLRHSRISAADKALLDETRKLACLPARSDRQFEAARLRTCEFTEPQIVEAVVMSALANFLNTLQAGLGPVPDFPPRRVFTTKDLYLLSGQTRPTSDSVVADDPDAALVARVQGGETDAFEELVRRHTRRIYGTLAGLVGNMDDARDATQDVFLKAFENLARFEGRSKFSTWLTSIAINTGTEILRQRKPSESLDVAEEDEGFRPRQIQSWADNPEELLNASQRDKLVKEAVLRLPEKYRVAVLLRDISELSTEEAAAALELSISALKARLLRGRLMLRERLATHFFPPEKGTADA